MVNLFLIEDSGCAQCSMRQLCHTGASDIQLYCHTGSGDVVDFIRRENLYQFLPKPDIFLINYHLASTHHAAISAIIRNTEDVQSSLIVLFSGTAPDPDLFTPQSHQETLSKFGEIDGFIRSPFQKSDLNRLLQQRLH